LYFSFDEKNSNYNYINFAFAQKTSKRIENKYIALHSDRIIGQDQFDLLILNDVFHKIKDNKAFEYKNVSRKITTVDIKIL
jgi:hypothetical protein